MDRVHFVLASQKMVLMSAKNKVDKSKKYSGKSPGYLAIEPWGNLKSTYSVVPKSDGNFKLTLISKTTDLKETYLIEKIDTGFCAIPTPKREDVGATILIECFKPVGK